MKPERKEIINDNVIEEFYWAGKIVCYVNNKLSKKTFDEEVVLLRAQ